MLSFPLRTWNFCWMDKNVHYTHYITALPVQTLNLPYDSSSTQMLIYHKFQCP